MSRKTIAIICAFLVALCSGRGQASEPETDGLYGMPKPASGEDAAIVRKNYFRNLWAEYTNGARETTVKFDDDLETKCPGEIERTPARKPAPRLRHKTVSTTSAGLIEFLFCSTAGSAESYE
jgi:hypothetical protein